MQNAAVIGDIHGCGKTLKYLLSKFSGDRPLFCVGDLFDRGERPGLVLSLVLEYNIITVFGNHEWLFVNGYKPDLPLYDIWLLNGGDVTEKFLKKEFDLEETGSILNKFPYYIDPFLSFEELSPGQGKSVPAFSDVLLCHAGVASGLTLEESVKRVTLDDDSKLTTSIIWNRKPAYLPGRFIVQGHSPVKNVKMTKNYINIDTGCVYGGKLTMLLLPEMEWIQVDNME